MSSTGEQGNDRIYNSDFSISSDGRYVAYSSFASNLVDGDTNEKPDVFVRDRQTGMTERINVPFSFLGSRGPSISADGRFVAFQYLSDVVVYDRTTGIIEQANLSSSGVAGNFIAYAPSISADGRFVAFSSHDSNLVDGDTNQKPDIFVRDRQAQMTERVNVSRSAGQQTQASSWYSVISDDGLFVAFSSFASNLVQGDTNKLDDIFVYDQTTKMTERVSVSSTGGQSNGRIYNNCVSISADGRFVTFSSYATNLVVDDTNNSVDVFVHDRTTGMTELVSVSSNGLMGNGNSYHPSISKDGRYVTFSSGASNLVLGDTNDAADVFVHDRTTGMTERVSVSSSGNQGNYGASSYDPLISADGRFVAFMSIANNLVSGDTNAVTDVFVTDNPLLDSNTDLITIEVSINGHAREMQGDAAQLQTGSLYEVNYKVTNNSPDRLTGVQIFEGGELVCDVYSLNPGQTKQRSRCAASRTVLSGDNHVRSVVTGQVSGEPTVLTNDTNAYYTGIDNATGELRLTHRINKINADSEIQAPTLDSSQASVSFKIENVGNIELYRVKTYHDPASPVNSGWVQQCFIGTLKPGQIRYCKRDISLSPSGIHKAWGRVQGKSAYVSTTGSVNAANPTYFLVP